MQTAPHQQPFAAHPLALLAASFTAGIVLAQSLTLANRLALACCFLISLLALTALIRRSHNTATLLVNLAFLSAGTCLALIQQTGVGPQRLKTQLDKGTIAAGEPVELTGVLERAPESIPGGFYLLLRSEQIRLKSEEKPVSGLVTLLLPINNQNSESDYQRLELRYGTRLQVMTVLNRLDNFRNPGVARFTEYLDRRGLDASGYVKSPLLIERKDDVPVFLPLAWLYQWRQHLESKILLHFSPETAGVLLASLLGNRYFLSRGTAERFREGGTFHVLVISGMHISFIGGFVLLFVRRLTNNRHWQFLVSTTVLWAYALAVGAESSVVRAALMFTLVAFAPLVSRQGTSLNSLGAAALILLVWRPSELFDPSFQLTFLAVLAIVIFAWPLLRGMSEIGSWRPTREAPCPPHSSIWLRTLCEAMFWSERSWKRETSELNYRYRLFKAPVARWLDRHYLQGPIRYALGAIVVSVCVQLTMLPLLILYFHRVSISSLVLNIGVSVLMASLALVGLMGLLIDLIAPEVARVFYGIANGLNWLMVHSGDPFVRWAISSVRIPEYSGWFSLIYVLYCLPLAALAFSLSRWRPLLPLKDEASWTARLTSALMVTQAILLVVVIAHPLSTGRTSELRVDFLDVGQGDSALITMPGGTTMLVDGGGRQTFVRQGSGEREKQPFVRDVRGVGDAVVSEYLWWRGLDRIDYVVASHADADHIDGLNDVARNFSVRAALVARSPLKDTEFAKFYQNASDIGMPIFLVGSGDVLRFGGISASILWPPAAVNDEAGSRNNDSIVMRVRFDECSILFTGDIERPAEAAILALEPSLQVDVVKVAHHGSKTSSTQDFIKGTQAKLAIISVGRTSIFGHPHQEVVERWHNRGAEVLTTGHSGMITVTTDGKNLQLETLMKGH